MIGLVKFGRDTAAKVIKILTLVVVINCTITNDIYVDEGFQ